MTTYIVLKSSDDGDLYRILGAWECNGPEQAIRKLANEEPGRYIAVPERNWTQVEAVITTPEPIFRMSEVEYLGPRIGEATDEPREGIEIAEGETAILVQP